MPRRTRRKYSPEQKADAVRLVKEVGNVAQVARDLDIGANLLHEWIKQSQIDAGRGRPSALTTHERDAELARLRRELRTVQMERDFLKKAAAFFAKDQDRPAS